MNTKLIIWILGILFGTILIGVVWYTMFVPKAAPQQAARPSTTLPTSGSITPTPTPSTNPSLATSSPAAQTMTLALRNGTSVVASDFIHNGVTISDTANEGRYLLAGNLGYCVSNPQKCQAASSTDFNIYYNSARQSFTIALTKEPLGQSRLDMEQFMLSTLGLTQPQMCGLEYYVCTTFDVNALYSTKNLGFSFCPGATVLPQ